MYKLFLLSTSQYINNPVIISSVIYVSAERRYIFMSLFCVGRKTNFRLWTFDFGTNISGNDDNFVNFIVRLCPENRKSYVGKFFNDK